MDREQAHSERDRLAGEHPEATWVVSEAAEGWQVLRIGLAPPKPMSTAVNASPEPPPEDPRTASMKNMPPFGTTPYIGI